MAKVTYQGFPEGGEDLFWEGLQIGDQYISPRIRIKRGILSPQKLLKITQRSLLPQIKATWDSFSDAEKLAWKAVDYHPHKHGWRTFVGDQSKRIKLGFTNPVVPNEYHQDIVGRIVVNLPAHQIKLIQPHPFNYWVQHRDTTRKNAYKLVNVTETFSLPLTIGVSYKSILAATGAGAYAKFYAEVMHLYQGREILTNLECNLNLNQDWTRAEETLTTLIGHAIAYNLYFDLYNVRGTLWFDNVSAYHNAQNWARDIYCQHIDTGFSKAYYQVPDHWAPEIMDYGSGFDSIYFQGPYPPMNDLAKFGQIYLGVGNFGKEV
jgi:hypothetical protein